MQGVVLLSLVGCAAAFAPSSGRISSRPGKLQFHSYQKKNCVLCKLPFDRQIIVYFTVLKAVATETPLYTFEKSSKIFTEAKVSC